MRRKNEWRIIRGWRRRKRRREMMEEGGARWGRES